jgi:hypothetical protein
LSPIFVRPVREQLEHDRLIRFLVTKYKRKFEVAANVGDQLTAPVKLGTATFYPDLVLTAGKKLAGLIEVESGESVNNLEAMAQWVHFARARVPFHLYVPVHVFDAARRLCEANRARVTEIWTYRPAVEGFDLVRLFHDPSAGTARSVPKPKPAAPASPSKVPKATKPPKASKARSGKPAAKAARPSKPAGRKR